MVGYLTKWLVFHYVIFVLCVTKTAPTKIRRRCQEIMEQRFNDLRTVNFAFESDNIRSKFATEYV